ncbi:MAG: hypothetical protein ACKVN9_07685 [Methylophilaceae bacterium]
MNNQKQENLRSPSIDETESEQRWSDSFAKSQNFLATLAEEALTTSVLTLAQQKELEHRLANHLANPNDVAPWSEVKAAALINMKQ